METNDTIILTGKPIISYSLKGLGDGKFSFSAPINYIEIDTKLLPTSENIVKKYIPSAYIYLHQNGKYRVEYKTSEIISSPNLNSKFYDTPEEAWKECRTSKEFKENVMNTLMKKHYDDILTFIEDCIYQEDTSKPQESKLDSQKDSGQTYNNVKPNNVIESRDW
jgi:hypothetical protein